MARAIPLGLFANLRNLGRSACSSTKILPISKVKQFQNSPSVIPYPYRGIRAPLKGSIRNIEAFQDIPLYEDLARFAVDDHNNKQNSVLLFKKLTNVRKKCVRGHIYYMTVEVADGGQKKVCGAEIFYRPLMNVKEVLEFGELPN